MLSLCPFSSLSTVGGFSIALLLLTPSIPLAAQEFEVSGFIRTHYYRSNALFAVKSNEFRAAISGCSANIRVNAPTEAAAYEELYSLKDYCFVFTSLLDKEITTRITYERGREIEQKLPKPQKLANDSIVDVYAQPIPIHSTSFPLMAVWLAYGSACYLRERAGQLIDPPFGQYLPGLQSPKQRVFGIQAPAVWDLTTLPPNLVSSFTLFRDGQALGLMPPYQGRTTNALYEVMAHTNMSGYLIPIASRLLFYRPDPTARDIPRVLQRGEMYIDVVAVSRHPPQMKSSPVITSRTRVLDYRFVRELHDPNPIAYTANEGRILERDQLMLLPGIGPTYFRGMAPQRHKWPIMGVYCAMGILVLTAFLGLWLARRNVQHRTNRNMKGKKL